MSKDQLPVAQMIGESFVDRTGQRWWVKGARPGSTDQFIVEAQMKGSYPRVAVYVMTEREFHAHAGAAELKRERPGSTSER
ncbi:hypothetical protein [Ramlibacter tataouinensis]|uniref:hypothetical protein n=1 Tax=Ramlibacter tataouinensis TaxID=94132 RepID=UPI00117CFF01|nr:hypothetical protein [Ramlibacter tataouinensis]